MRSLSSTIPNQLVVLACVQSGPGAMTNGWIFETVLAEPKQSLAIVKIFSNSQNSCNNGICKLSLDKYMF
jgi:hypothetical protein